MQKKPGLFFLLLFILTALAGFSAKQTWPENSNVNKQELVIKTFHLPHAELERPQTTTVVSGQVHGNRTVNLSLYTTCPLFKIFFQPATPAQKSKQALSFKEYLFYIYPSHNFW